MPSGEARMSRPPLEAQGGSHTENCVVVSSHDFERQTLNWILGKAM